MRELDTYCTQAELFARDYKHVDLETVDFNRLRDQAIKIHWLSQELVIALAKERERREHGEDN